MLSRLSQTTTRRLAKPAFAVRFYEPIDTSFASPEEAIEFTAKDALTKSCYNSIDWKIKEDEKVIDMLKIMVANKVGALAVTDGTGEVVGIVSERDYLSKVAFLGKTSDETTVKEISTYGIDNIVSVSQGNPIERCMEKLLGRDVRHLLIREEKSHKSPIVGMISVKDIVKCAHEKSKAQMNRMEEIITYQNISNSAV
ncbi:hypothetical protein TrCOL_g10117 [Triparma columacea]|uniref:CBS domain-containing protein n=1 Tax=Triparma columacea TaxID=722753 RepID=A0A9W7L9W1_9STRA|nr:hypothetical protein TrCOL_g10117 [Triparma columacea]